MNGLTVLVVLAVFVICAFGQQPAVPCRSPPQFHARIHQYDHGEDISRRYLFQYDELGGRTAFYEEETENYPGRRFYKYLYFYTQKVAYEIDLKSNDCSRIPVPLFRPISIPLNATFESDYNLGGPSKYIVVQDWSDRIPLRKNAEVYMTFTVDDCYPVRWTTVENHNVTASVSTSFYDVINGVPFPNDFVVPQECAEAPFKPPKYSPKYMW